ncbi:MAG: HEAT repeat domain-containing protein [Labilithrix sp.]|nr:HEAT repeat domain-containing protein [Labilithrix sp.]
MTRQRLRVLVAVVALALVGAALARARSGSVDGGEPRTTLEWPAGKEEVYALTWTTTTSSRVMMAAATPTEGGGGSIETKVALDGDLVVSSYGREGDEVVLGARFEHLTRAEVNALGKPLLPSMDVAREVLEGRSVEIVVKPSGEIARVRFRPADPALFRYLMHAVVTELGVRVIAPGASASADLDGPSGRGPVRFARDPGQPRLITRTRERYDVLGAWPVGEPPPQTLESKGHVAIDPEDGTLAEVVETEKLEAARSPEQKDITSSTSFSLKKKATRDFDVTTARAGFADVPLSPLAADAGETEEARRARLEQRTVGVTIESIVDDIRLAAAVPKGGSTRWGWVAMGYLELHPDKCNELVDRMKELDVDAQALAIDVLSSTGHEAAQAAAMRAFDPDARILRRGSPEEAILFMRLGFFSQPTRGLTDFVAARYAKAKEEDDTPMRRASAIALGDLISAVAKTDRLYARELDDALVLDLYAAKSFRDRVILIQALGNAALEEDALAIRLQSHDPEHDVRVAVAGALRRFDSPEVRRTLIELIGDERLGVQLQALASLDRKNVSEQELQALLGYVEKKKIHSTNMQALANFMVKRKDSPMGRAILDTLVEQDDLDPQTRARMIRIRDGA